MVDFRNNDCNVLNVMMWQKKKKKKYAGDAGVDGSSSVMEDLRVVPIILQYMI